MNIQHNVDELRRIRAPDDANYKCTVCSWFTHIDEYERHTPNWCAVCEQVQTFKRIDPDRLSDWPSY